MNAATLAVLLIFGTGFVAVTGGLALAALKILKGSPRRHSQQPDIDETKLIQELYQGLSRMEERIEVLETLVLDQDRQTGPTRQPRQDRQARKGGQL
jgi:phage shock protein B